MKNKVKACSHTSSVHISKKYIESPYDQFRKLDTIEIEKY